MDTQIKDLIDAVALDVMTKLPRGIENKYYSKMSYSDINVILDLKKELLHKNISFEIAFIHVIAYIFVRTSKLSLDDYHTLLCKLDVENLFCWYKIGQAHNQTILSTINFDDYRDIYSLINLHDTLVDKDIKKKIGQFYTPIEIVKKMVDEIKPKIRLLKIDKKIADPACGTGIFLVETLKILDSVFAFEEKIEFVNNYIYAYDVNPFAIIATKLNLIYTLCLQNRDNASTIIDKVLQSDVVFRNIRWRNTIVEEDANLYTIILGNPPYFKLKNALVKNLETYKEIAFGQPNIYSFFVYWSLKHLEKEGALCLIVPQSIRSGLYFKNLRSKISDLRIKSVIHIDSRQNIFDRAEQAVLIIYLENKAIGNTKTKIQFYNSNNTIYNELKIDRSRLMMNECFNNIFIIARSAVMYDIFEKVYRENHTFDHNSSNFKFCNGLFVWNQHKDDIVDQQEGAIPIIYGGNVQPLCFNFNVCSSNEERKQYSKVGPNTKQFVLSGKRLLIQRTTNFESNIRIKSCIIEDTFLKRNEKYFLENHVNFLSFRDNKDSIIEEDSLYYYLGLLNSKLLNYIFTSKSGNTQVSTNELNSLPFTQRNFEQISQFVREHIYEMKEYQRELDTLVCQAYELSLNEIDYIINN